MAGSDSDNSADESSVYATTNVLLGFASLEPTDDLISQLGGVPTWIDPIVSPSATLARCSVCKSMMVQLLQLHGNLPDRFPDHERRLHVFICRRRGCRRKSGSVKAFRAVRVTRSGNITNDSPPKSEVANTASQPNSNIGSEIFGKLQGQRSSPATPNPFSKAPQNRPLTTTNPFSFNASKGHDSPTPSDTRQEVPVSTDSGLAATFADKARIHSTSVQDSRQSSVFEPWPSPSEMPSAYPSYFLDADFETLESEESLAVDPNAFDQQSASTSQDLSTDKEEAGAFESTIDKTFQKFADRLAQNPDQVLRYEYGGPPLLFSDRDRIAKLFPKGRAKGSFNGVRTVPSAGADNHIPGCSACGSARQFELQLVPQAITELEANEIGLEGMDWGTIILAACSKDCQASGTAGDAVSYLEEWVGVQWEDQHG